MSITAATGSGRQGPQVVEDLARLAGGAPGVDDDRTVVGQDDADVLLEEAVAPDEDPVADLRPASVRHSVKPPPLDPPDGILAAMTEPRTIVFFPEGAFGPTNNCVGIGSVLRERGHRVVFIVEESFAGTLEAKGFEERLMRLGPPPEVPEVPGQFWKDFIRDTAPVFRTPDASSS